MRSAGGAATRSASGRASPFRSPCDPPPRRGNSLDSSRALPSSTALGGLEMIPMAMRLTGVAHALLFCALAFCAGAAAQEAAIPPYDHIMVIIAENHGYDEVIGNPRAPNLNRLARLYGLASNFYGEVHPSEANYVAMLGGDTFGIHDDDAWYSAPGSDKEYCDSARDPTFRAYSD